MGHCEGAPKRQPRLRFPLFPMHVGDERPTPLYQAWASADYGALCMFEAACAIVEKLQEAADHFWRRFLFGSAAEPSRRLAAPPRLTGSLLRARPPPRPALPIRDVCRSSAFGCSHDFVPTSRRAHALMTRPQMLPSFFDRRHASRVCAAGAVRRYLLRSRAPARAQHLRDARAFRLSGSSHQRSRASLSR